MSLQAHMQRLQSLKSELERDHTDILEAAATTMLRKIKRRITHEGKNSENADMGSYSTTPITVAQKQFVNKGSFKAGGKTGRGKKTMYLPSGYRQLKQIQGLEAGKVNASYSGHTTDSYVVVKTGKRVFLGMNNKTASRKRRYIEEKYGPVYLASKDEYLAYKKEVNNGLKQLTLKKLLGHV